jgi:hypothetical protein
MESIYQRTKRQRNLIIVFFLVLIITFTILYFGYFKKEKTIPARLPEISPPEKKIEIDFSVFENPILKELQPIEKIEPPKPEEIGRENPFSQLK